MLIGTLKKYPTRSDAERAVEHLRMEVNKDNPQQSFHAATVRGLVDRYKQEDLPEQYSTRISYFSNLDAHILPRWGNTFLERIYPMDLQAWLRNLKSLDGKNYCQPRPEQISARSCTSFSRVPEDGL